MGSGYSTAGAQNPLANLGAYSMFMPQLAKETASAIPGISNALTTATEQSTPALNALNLQQLQQYAPQLSTLGSSLTNQQELAGANTIGNVLSGPGAANAASAVNLNRQLNPDYYSAMDAASKGAASAVNAINLNGLSPGESNAVERSLNQTNTSTGNLGLVNPMNTINNAINFGGAFNNKIGLMNQTTGNAANVASIAAGNGGVNPVGVALSQPGATGSNFGTNQFQSGNTGSSQGAGSMGFGFGNNMMNNLTSGNNAAIGAGASMANNMSPSSLMSSTGSLLGGVCCFIFMQANNGILPLSVRVYRDKYYHWHPTIAFGYKRMASWLVPLMRKYNIVKGIVNIIMVKPCIKYSLGKRKYKLVAHFWLRIWALIGRI